MAMNRHPLLRALRVAVVRFLLGDGAGYSPRMEINLVVLNLGNSRLGVGVFRAGELGEVKRLPNREPAQWVEAIAEAWRRIDGTENAAVVAASVNPDLE